MKASNTRYDVLRFHALAFFAAWTISSLALAQVPTGSSLHAKDARATNAPTAPNLPPNWQSPGATQGASTPGGPGAAVTEASQPNRGAQYRPKPPTPRDCKNLFAKPDPDYVLNYHIGATNIPGPDPNSEHGNIITETKATVNHLQGDLNDLQVRIAQMRCEQDNLMDKVDFLIRFFP